MLPTRSCRLFACAILAACLSQAADVSSPGFTAAELFNTSAIWTAQLTISPEQWLVMQPVQYDRKALIGATGEKSLRNGFLAMSGVDLAWAHGDLDFEGRTFTDVGVRYKGNASFNMARDSRPRTTVQAALETAASKTSFKVHLNEYRKGVKFAGITTLNFQNNVADPGWMNEVIAYRLYRDAGVPAPRTAYVRLYLTISGAVDRHYLGLYSLSEDIDKSFTGDRFATTKGALIKPYDKVDLFGWRGDDWRNYIQLFDPKSVFTPDQKKSYMDFCNLVSNAGDAAFAERLPELLDIEEFARFLAVTVWISDSDNIVDNGHNFYAFLNPANGKLLFLPWDLDHAFGQYRMSPQRPVDRSILRPWTNRNHLLERIFQVEAFRKAYLERMAEFSRTIFEPARIAAQIDELAPLLRPAIAAESAVKLTRFDRQVEGNSGVSPEPIKSFVFARAKSVTAQLATIP